MKYITALFIVALFSGCGAVEREIAKFSGYSTICVEGVEYIQFTSGASVAYKPDGTVKTCKE